MEIPKLIILLCYTAISMASEHSHQSHIIPIENYETELQVLDQHVEIPEPPTRLVKITKTVAVKIPVPYPVKVVEKVPYPVHVSKPYPVPVPQIVHVPQPSHGSYHEQNHGQYHGQNHGGASGAPYQVQEHEADSYSPQQQHSFEGHSGYGGPNFGIGDYGHSAEHDS